MYDIFLHHRQNFKLLKKYSIVQIGFVNMCVARRENSVFLKSCTNKNDHIGINCKNNFLKFFR